MYGCMGVWCIVYVFLRGVEYTGLLCVMKTRDEVALPMIARYSGWSVESGGGGGEGVIARIFVICLYNKSKGEFWRKQDEEYTDVTVGAVFLEMKDMSKYES